MNKKPIPSNTSNIAPKTTEYSLADLTSWYKSMLLIRRFEEKAAQLYGMGLIGGFCHLYIGQEAVVVGIQSVLQGTDTVITSYRDHGHMLACGMDPSGVMAELTGRSGGYSKGKGGSMHMFSREKNFFGGHGIVGAQVPLGTGLAFAHNYLKDSNVCLTYLGDGAVNQGQVYESFNMAALWKLPVVYIIENNKYGMGTSVARASANPEQLYQRAQGYGIPGQQVDGMDIFSVRQAAKVAVDRARKGDGPSLLEMRTYRYRGHSMSDPAKYRSKEEVNKMKEEFDPIDRLLARMKKEFSFTEEQVEHIEADIRNIVLKAADFAQKSPEPDAKELYTDILLNA